MSSLMKKTYFKNKQWFPTPPFDLEVGKEELTNSQTK